ncbi:MAG: type II toxin-antitoxin system VapC family toxin [Caldilinea sp.]|nr:type II toxin-antitoxin system VapC family toxin [Caldilinea sp.]MCB0057587.1 type II toxin-antitoxin system VapC family toxin [Caldilineaceae bacterium]MCB0053872.1 type II toxin-antitoxin system VapC family toxin [Caldilinea sp.]MCB0065589.1 type II toxin-antitoxin system VapC family toxin [Caldilineaceae bacterium]MCB0133481.1 type II toxin-antitoxin system VapC family toxin [Caldilineaceae bacterium]
MNVVDSSGWLEYFADGPNADFFAPAIEATEQLLVPVICIYEVFKRILQQKGLGAAETRIADLYKGAVIELTPSLAISAAVISDTLKLPMADSIILATARSLDATLWTQDDHFQGLAGVKYIAKPAGGG